MRYVPVIALLALGLHTDSGSASIRTPETTPRSGGVPVGPGDTAHMGQGMARALDLALEIDSGVEQRG